MARSIIPRPPRAIPTRVGKSLCNFLFCCPLAGHPHAGGEIQAVKMETLKLDGPSPRGWGNQRIWEYNDKGERAIPTRVGKSHNVFW